MMVLMPLGLPLSRLPDRFDETRLILPVDPEDADVVPFGVAEIDLAAYRIHGNGEPTAFPEARFNSQRRLGLGQAIIFRRYLRTWSARLIKFVHHLRTYPCVVATKD